MSNKGTKHTEETKRKLSTQKISTTPETDVLVKADRLTGMTMRALSTKHQLGVAVIFRIIHQHE